MLLQQTRRLTKEFPRSEKILIILAHSSAFYNFFVRKPAPPKKYTSKRVVQQEVSQSAEKLVRQKKSPKMLPDKSTKSSQSEQRDISSKDTSKTSLQMSAELESDQVNSSIEHEESVNFGDEENVKSGDEEKMLPAKSTAAKTNAGVSETYAHHPG